MKDYLLYRKLNLLTREEYKAFIAFAESPYFNTSKRVPQLLRLIENAHPNFEESAAISENTLVKKLGLPSMESLRQLRTKAANLLPQFYIQHELHEQPNTSRLLLLDALQKRMEDQELYKELNAFENSIDPDNRPFHTRFRLDDFRLRELLRRQESLFVFERYIESGNRYFLLKKLKQACMLRLFQQIYKKQSENTLFTELDFLLPLHESLIEGSTVLQAWRQLYELLINPDQQDGYANLQEFIARRRTEFPAKEHKDLFNTANNLLIGMFTQGRYNTLPELNWFYQTLFQQYQLATSEGLLHEGGYLQHGRLKNVVAAACNSGQTAWARAFVESHIDLLLPQFRDNVREFCLGSIAFYENNHVAAAQHLARVSTHDDDFYFFDLESVQLRIFFLENNFDLFEARSEAVRKKLTRSRLSEAHLKNYGNYFRLLKELFQLRHQSGTTAEQWEDFRQMVEQTNPVNQKKWLLEHIGN